MRSTYLYGRTFERCCGAMLIIQFRKSYDLSSTSPRVENFKTLTNHNVNTYPSNLPFITHYFPKMSTHLNQQLVEEFQLAKKDFLRGARAARVVDGFVQRVREMEEELVSTIY